VLPAVRWVDVHDREGGPVLVALSVVVGERLQPLCGAAFLGVATTAWS
jgi:hypothetical protein